MSKKLKVKNIRNILESPLNITWQEKSHIELSPIQNILNETLPNAKVNDSTQITWRKGEKKEKPHREKNLYRSYLAIGYQSVLRGMEKKELSCVLLSNEVTPIVLLKMALALAHSNSIPVLVVPDLKSITKFTLGFSSMALGFKTNVTGSNIFYPIVRFISENPTMIETPFQVNTETKETPLLNQDTENTLKYQGKEMAAKYLHRVKHGVRAFTPNSSSKNKVFEKTEKKKSTDFIAFSNSNSDEVQSRTGNNLKFQSENMMIDSDDSDSDEGDLFFIDIKPNEALLKKSEDTKVKVPGQQKGKLNPPSKKKTLQPNQYSMSQSVSARFQHTNLKAVSSNNKRSKKKNKKKNSKKSTQ